MLRSSQSTGSRQELADTRNQLGSRISETASQLAELGDALARIAELIEEAASRLRSATGTDQLRDIAALLRAAVAQGLSIVLSTQGRAGQLEGVGATLDQLQESRAYLRATEQDPPKP
jgi:methyl-accepting chemotaxis protein